MEPHQDTSEKTQPQPEGSREQGVLKRRMTDAAMGNFLCSCWHVYLGFSLISARSSSVGGRIFLGFAALQILAGVLMLGRPKTWLFAVDAGIYGFCAIANLVAAQMGGPGFIKFLGLIQIGLAFDAYRRYKLFRRPPQADASPVVVAAVESPPDGVPEIASEGDSVPEEVCLAGFSRDGQWVVTEEEIGRVRETPELFDNVLVGVEPRPTGTLKWYLVLARGEAVLLDQTGDMVRRFAPDDIRKLSKLTKELTVRPGEGAKTKMVFEEGGLYAILAWQADSEEEFEQTLGAAVKTTRWDLLCWRLTTGKNPGPWLRWAPSFGSVEAGVRAMCQQGGVLGQQLKRCEVSKAEKWVERVPAEDARILREAIGEVSGKQARLLKLLALVCLFVGVPSLVTAMVWIEKSQGDSPGQLALVFLAIGTLIPAPVLFGVGIWRGRIQKRMLNPPTD